MISINQALPPLRGAIVAAIGDGVPVTDAQIAELAGVDVSRAKAYLTSLEESGIVRRFKKGCKRGKNWHTWSKEVTRRNETIRTTDATAYKIAKVRRTLREIVCNACDTNGISNRDLACRSGVALGYIARLRSQGVPPPFCEMIVIAKSLGLSLDSLSAS